MTWQHLITAILYASAIAWFVNVLITRVPGAEPLLARPRCTHCATALAWYEQFPVLSHLARRGRCRACGQALGIRYLLAELACFVASLLVLSAELPTLVGIAWLLYVPVAVALAFIDLGHKRLPDVLTLPAAVGALVILGLDAIVSGNGSFGTAVFAAFALFALYFALNLISRGGMGMGDVKLALSIGALTGYFGWISAIDATFIAFLVGGVVSAFMLARGIAGRKGTIPFGPFMLVGAFAALPGIDLLAGLLVV